MNMIERVARAIDAVQIWSRFNDWTDDRVEGLPIEICRYGSDGEDEIVVLKRFPASEDTETVLRNVISEMRARAAIEAMMEPTPHMLTMAWACTQKVDPEERMKVNLMPTWQAHNHKMAMRWNAMCRAALSENQ